MSDFLTIDELAQRWRTTKSALYDRRKTGRPMPPAIRVGRRLIFRLEAIERFEKEMTED